MRSLEEAGRRRPADYPYRPMSGQRDSGTLRVGNQRIPRRPAIPTQYPRLRRETWRWKAGVRIRARGIHKLLNGSSITSACVRADLTDSVSQRNPRR